MPKKVLPENSSPKVVEARTAKISDEVASRDRILIAEDMLRRVYEESKTNKVEPAAVVVNESVAKVESKSKDKAIVTEQNQKAAESPATVTKLAKVEPKPLATAQVTPKKAELPVPKPLATIEKLPKPKTETPTRILPETEKPTEPEPVIEQTETIIFESLADENLLAEDTETIDWEEQPIVVEPDSPIETLTEIFEVTAAIEGPPAETDFYNELAEVLYSALTVTESTEDESANSATELFDGYLETLEPAQAEEAQGIIEVLRNDIQFLKLDLELSDDEREAVEAGIYKLTERLFKVLGIEYDEKVIKRFIQTASRAAEAENPDPEQFSADYLNWKGTQEYKTDIASHVATRLAKINIPMHQFLASYILRLALA